MAEHNQLAEQFESHRARLRAVAYRMLGSAAEAEDAVQESWLHASRSESGHVDNLSGWLTTIVARVCLDVLRSRKSRRDDSNVRTETFVDPEQQALLADSVGAALLVVLETLGPAERLAFVLHDLFALPFDDIAPVIGCSSAAARQLASRARRRVRGSTPPTEADAARQHEVVAAFLAASHHGNFDALFAVLDPDVVVRADDAAVRMGALAEMRGAEIVARTLVLRARGAHPAVINGLPGAVWAPGGKLRVVYDFSIRGDKVVAIDLIADEEDLGELELILQPA